jgi:hypothetical protein
MNPFPYNEDNWTYIFGTERKGSLAPPIQPALLTARGVPVENWTELLLTPAALLQEGEGGEGT